MTEGFSGSIGFRNTAIAGGVIIAQNADGLFAYSGNPTLGNLIASIASTNGTDPYGNKYPAAVGTENNGAFTARGDNTETNYAILAVPVSNDPILILNQDSTAFSDGYIQSLKDGSGPFAGKITILTTAPTGKNANSIEMLSQLSDGSSGPVTKMHSDLAVDGLLSAGNVQVGSVNITPSAANTPTSKAITFGPLTGTNFFGLVSAATTVPGTTVTGVGVTGVTSTGATIWVTRTNTTQTTVNYMIWGV